VETSVDREGKTARERQWKRNKCQT